MQHFWICHRSQPAPSERQQPFLPVISLHTFPSIQNQSLVTRVFHLGHQGKQEAKKHTRMQTARAGITAAKALNFLLITVTTFSFSYINYQTRSYLLLFPDYSGPVHLLAHLEVDCQSPSCPSLCVVTYKDDTCPWALLRIWWYKHHRQGWIAFHICCPDVLQFSFPLRRD